MTASDETYPESLEYLAYPHGAPSSLTQGYRQAAVDEEQEQEALEWSNALIGDIYESR